MLTYIDPRFGILVLLKWVLFDFYQAVITVLNVFPESSSTHRTMWIKKIKIFKSEMMNVLALFVQLKTML